MSEREILKLDSDAACDIAFGDDDDFEKISDDICDTGRWEFTFWGNMREIDDDGDFWEECVMDYPIPPDSHAFGNATWDMPILDPCAPSPCSRLTLYDFGNGETWVYYGIGEGVELTEIQALALLEMVAEMRGLWREFGLTKSDTEKGAGS